MRIWKVFKDKRTGRELCAYTLPQSTPDEEETTIALLCFEEHLKPEQIAVSIEKRK